MSPRDRVIVSGSRPRRGDRFLYAPHASRLDRLLSDALTPAAVLFGVGTRIRRRLHETGPLRTTRMPVPVIAIGNLTLGGTGKTPLAIWITQTLVNQGAAPAIVTRGYGARAGSAPRRVRAADPCESDEARLLAGRFPSLPVIAGRDRVAGIRLAMDSGAGVIVLDDAFQHLAVARDLDILLLDPRVPYPTGRTLPAGPMREPWSAATRADLYVVVDGPTTPSPNGREPIRARRQATSLRLGGDVIDSPKTLQGRPVFLLSGIGQPAGFRALVEAQGASVVGETHYSDHHRFRPDEVREAQVAARGRGAEHLVVTEKDAIRLPSTTLADPFVAVLEIGLVFDEGEDRLVAAIRKGIEAQKGTGP